MCFGTLNQCVLIIYAITSGETFIIVVDSKHDYKQETRVLFLRQAFDLLKKIM